MISRSLLSLVSFLSLCASTGAETSAKAASNFRLQTIGRAEHFRAGRELVELEQSVADYNADWVATSANTAQACRHRRLIALPLDEKLFDPPMVGVFSHGHEQTGDKMSLPSCFSAAIHLNNAEVP